MAEASSPQRTVEFYLSSLWSWLPEGSKRFLEALESCNLVSLSTIRSEGLGHDMETMGHCLCPVNMVQEQAHFEWDGSCDWFHIRCLEEDKDYIMKEYLKVQSEMENELKEMGVIQVDGSLNPNVENDLVGTLRSRVAVPDEFGEPQVADSTERGNMRYPKGHGHVKKAVERKAPNEGKAYHF